MKLSALALRLREDITRARTELERLLIAERVLVEYELRTTYIRKTSLAAVLAAGFPAPPEQHQFGSWWLADFRAFQPRSWIGVDLGADASRNLADYAVWITKVPGLGYWWTNKPTVNAWRWMDQQVAESQTTRPPQPLPDTGLWL